MLAWAGFACGLMALASICISFASPYWIQTWPMSESPFKNMGLWHVCFNKYMQFKDDSQELYSGCWWVFDMQPKYYKLREWLTPPWFITCQVLVVGCLLILITTSLIVAMIFLHQCPIMNHEYLQTYGMFSAGSLMILVIALIFGIQTNDRYWLPRPDLNFLSWGYGFLIITGLFSLASGILLYKEAQKTYDTLLRKEDEYTKAALEMSTYQLEPPSSLPDYDYSAGYPSYPAPQASQAAGKSQLLIQPESYPQVDPGYEHSYAPGSGMKDADTSWQVPPPPAAKGPLPPFAGKSFQQLDDGDDFV
ncbi:hypothetical protein HELRODRAFT_91254 [Helobdella robusta]|uniref:Claudin n=1 Tax=Helobdella robusta TaxID=6412 RepID=T1G820_HELRO|nr:hypothetical protein HELRODRAFT_91254 [Helobdella robusta]ESN89893.1 hypothetical protein HELRODRAFT_91254 [Helobdella robusta]